VYTLLILSRVIIIKDISDMDNQVCSMEGNISAIGNKDFHVIVKIWICRLFWKRLGRSSLGQPGSVDNSGEFSIIRVGSAIGGSNLVSW
jgi:hypothetical protein